MSRVIVKNLPTNVTVDKLREKFGEKGRVTDVQLKYTASGKFRKFGFVGYHTPEEAEEAIKFFNNSYYNTSRLQVELCAELGDANKPKAWSKYAPEKKLHTELPENDIKEKEKKKVKEKKTKAKKIVDQDLLEKLKKHKDDPEFVEFLESHGENPKELLEAVEDSDQDESEEEKEDEEDKKEISIANAPISDMEYLKLKTKSGKEDGSKDTQLITKPLETEKKEKIPFYTVKLRNLPYKTKRGNIKSLLTPLKPASVRLVPKIKGIAYVGFKTEKEMRQALVKNKTFLNGKQVFISEYKEANENPAEKERWKTQEQSLANEESIAESGRIFLRNLSYTVTEDELQELFSKYGPVTEVVVPIDKVSRQVKGFGIVTYMIPEHAVKAYTALDGTIFHGRMLHLLPGKPKESPDEEADGSFKAQKQKKLREQAKSSHTWNTLFLGQNAVAEVIADKYNATKQEVLTGSDAAVRLALGETQIVTETKQFLEENGVCLDAFNQEVKKRSKTVILVKNLPAKTTAAEIRDIFGKYGELGRVLLPPSGVTGIVEFLEPSEARTAFTKLAYSKFKYLPLYLEWAPENTFSEKKEEIVIKKENDTDENESRNKAANESVNDGNEVMNDGNEDNDEIEPEPDTTLFIKNLDFSTTEESLRKLFSSCGKIADATIAKKKDSAHPGQILSMGYGFVQFYLRSSLNEALKTLQGVQLDGHQLELKRSNRTVQADLQNLRKKNNVKNQTGSKIIVRNIPFQATANEVKELFKTFGELKSVRIPKKLVGTGPHRGFGFVEFMTKHDAKRAMKALCQSTHLFGRRLVLEWAENEEDIQEIRKRTAKNFIFDEVSSAKKSKKAVSKIMDGVSEKGMNEDGEFESDDN